MHAEVFVDDCTRIALQLASLPAQHVTVGIVGGSDLVKISEQLNADKSEYAVAAASPRHIPDRPTTHTRCFPLQTTTLLMPLLLPRSDSVV